MKYLLLFFCTPCFAFQMSGNAFVLSPEEVKQCQNGGSCIIVTQKEIDRLVQQAFNEGVKSSRKVSIKSRELMCKK